MSTLDITDVRTAIESANAIFMRTFNSGDAAGMASFYTIDGQILPHNADSVSGEEGFQAFRKGLIDMGIKEVELLVREVEACGETAFEVSEYKLYGEGRTELDKGKYIVIWKNIDGEWKLHRDIFNSSNPAPG